MINLAVIELKDIMKYLIKITVIIVIIVGATKYFSNFKNKVNIQKGPLLSCLDVVIPSFKNVNQEENKEEKKANIEPLKLTLEVELGMINSIEKNNKTEVIDAERRKRK